MSKRNPIKSMTGNMWSMLRKLRPLRGIGEMRMLGGGYQKTMSALCDRQLAVMARRDTYKITALGCLVFDAFDEGQESVK